MKKELIQALNLALTTVVVTTVAYRTVQALKAIDKLTDNLLK